MLPCIIRNTIAPFPAVVCVAMAATTVPFAPIRARPRVLVESKSELERCSPLVRNKVEGIVFNWGMC